MYISHGLFLYSSTILTYHLFTFVDIRFISQGHTKNKYQAISHLVTLQPNDPAKFTENEESKRH